MSPNPERSEPDVNTTEHSPGDAEVIDINLKIASQFAREIRKKSYTNLSGEVLAEKLGLLLDADRPGKNTLQGKLIRLIDTGGNNLDDDTFYDEKIRRDEIMQMLVGILNDTRSQAHLYKHERHITNQLVYMRGTLPNKTKDDELWFKTVDRLFVPKED